MVYWSFFYHITAKKKRDEVLKNLKKAAMDLKIKWTEPCLVKQMYKNFTGKDLLKIFKNKKKPKFIFFLMGPKGDQKIY